MICELYKFTVGSTVYGYTDADDDVTYGGTTYEAVEIERTAIESASEISQRQITITTDKANVFAGLFIPAHIEKNISIVVTRFDGNSTYSVKFTGYVQGVEFENYKALIVCAPVKADFSRNICSLRYSKKCQYVVFSDECGADESAFEATGTISDISGLTVTATVFGTEDNGYWVGGRLYCGQETAFITAHSGSTVTLLRAFSGAAINDSVTVSPGCDQNPETCHTKFSNIINFGGFDAIPDKDPHIKGFTK